jgi:RNA polymerase sigma-70 factor (ECF subfamily)
MDTDEAMLLRAAARGDERAFLDLYLRHREVVLRFSYRLVGSTADAEDMTQQCFLDLLRRPEGFDPGRGASLRTYLYAAVRHIALKHLHRSTRELLADDPPECICGDPTPLDRLLSGETAAAVREAVAALPYLQREALVLFEYEDLSLAEIAVIAECEVGTVKDRLRRARQRLRRTLAPLMPVRPSEERHA